MTPTYYIGEIEDIRALLEEEDAQAFTITSVVLTVTHKDGTVVRNAVAAEFLAGEVWYHEEFSTANGYVAGGTYQAIFTPTVTLSAVTYKPKDARVTFWVTAP
jgi:hypothetical protein